MSLLVDIRIRQDMRLITRSPRPEMNDLPPELLLVVFSHLDRGDLLPLRLVSRSFRSLADDRSLSNRLPAYLDIVSNRQFNALEATPRADDQLGHPSAVIKRVTKGVKVGKSARFDFSTLVNLSYYLPNVETLSFVGIKLGGHQIKDLSQVLPRLAQITALCFARTYMVEDGLDRLGVAICSMRSLKILDLSWNCRAPRGAYLLMEEGTM